MDRGIVDSHQHFWRVGLHDYPWMSPDVETLHRDYLPGDLEPLADVCGVARTVLVQASNSVEETLWLLNLADAHPLVAGVVGWVDLASAEVGRQLDELAAYPKLKGVRHLVESEPDPDWLVQPKVLEGLAELAARDLAYDLLVHTRHLKHVPAIAAACPELRLVVDHMAKPPIARGEIDEWSREIEKAAAIESVHCKLSGLVTEANHASWRTEHLQPYVDRALALFGPERLMFGSDWPVCLLAASYRQVLESFRALLGGLSDRERRFVFSENAARFYVL
jgi:L-fuconolactonase